MDGTIPGYPAEDWCAEIHVGHVSTEFIETLRLGSAIFYRTVTLTDSLEITRASPTDWRIADQIVAT